MSSTEVAEWPGVARPHRADARRNFDALLAAARAAFAADGVDASLEDIARRAEVGIGTLYRNFPTRDALIEAVYVNEVDNLVIAADAVAGLPAWDAFRSWLDSFFDYVGTKRVLIDSLNRDSLVMQSCRVAMYGAGGPLLERAQAAGAVRSDVTISDVLVMFSSIANAKMSDDQRGRVIEIAVDGLRAR